MKKRSRKIGRPKTRIGDYADEQYRKEALWTLALIEKGKPDKGKQWIAHEEHNFVLYGGTLEESV